MVKDLFSIQSNEYTRYRPGYPKEIYNFLNLIVSLHERAWDCATGTDGQLLDWFPDLMR
jgi:hypothetical protein